MGKFASHCAKIKSKFTLPEDNRGIRITLMILSVLLLIVAILGVFLLAAYLPTIGEPPDDDDDLLYGVGEGLVLFWIFALILKIVPCVLGYQAARGYGNYGACFWFGAVWSVLSFMVYGYLLDGSLRFLFTEYAVYLLPLLMAILIPPLWVSLILIVKLRAKD